MADAGPGRFKMKSKTQKTAPRKGRVFLMDRHAIVRRAVARWIGEEPGLAVCGTTGSPASAFRFIARLKPDLVVTEIIESPDLGFIRELRERFPTVPILVFSLHEAAWFGTSVLEAGANAFVAKDAPGEALLSAVHEILAHAQRPRPSPPRRAPAKRPARKTAARRQTTRRPGAPR
jgi:DNA-binding NarL/FixJ family response regulator